MLLYLCIARPFDKTLSNVLNIYNEVIVVFCYSAIAIINIGQFTTRTIMNVGWMLISVILLSLGASWFIMLPGATKELIKSFKEYIFSEAQQENITDSQAVKINDMKLTVQKTLKNETIDAEEKPKNRTSISKEKNPKVKSSKSKMNIKK